MGGFSPPVQHRDDVEGGDAIDDQIATRASKVALERDKCPQRNPEVMPI